MKATTRFETTHAFVVDEKDVQKLWTILGEICPIYEAKIYCSDDISRFFEGPTDILNYDNSTRTKILSMEFSGISDSKDTSIDIIISDRHVKTLSFNIRGEEKEISKLRTELIDYFQGLKPWYSRLATFDLFFLWMPIFLIIVFTLTVKFPQNSSENLAVTLKQSITVGFAASFILGCCIAICIAVIIGSKKLAKTCFPIGTFSIGQGVKRHALAEQIRWTVIVGMAISFFISFAFYLISQ